MPDEPRTDLWIAGYEKGQREARIQLLAMLPANWADRGFALKDALERFLYDPRYAPEPADPEPAPAATGTETTDA